MTFTDKRKRSRTPDIEPDLLEQGINQLKMEIEILGDWLQNLNASDTEQLISYKDMLQSRKEMLQSLQQQKADLTAKKQSRTPKSPDA